MRTPAKRTQRFKGWVGALIGAGLAVAACDLAGGGVDSDLDEDGGAAAPDGGARLDGAVAPEEDGGDGEDDGGDRPDVGGGDAEPDGSCGGRWSCGGRCVDDCRGCVVSAEVRALACATTGACVAACSGCDGRPHECFACSSGPMGVGSCQPLDSPCMRGDYAHCACAEPPAGGSDTLLCPGGSQVCVRQGVVGECRTCGEGDTDGLACKRGGTCIEVISACGGITAL